MVGQTVTHGGTTMDHGIEVSALAPGSGARSNAANRRRDGGTRATSSVAAAAAVAVIGRNTRVEGNVERDSVCPRHMIR